MWRRSAHDWPERIAAWEFIVSAVTPPQQYPVRSQLSWPRRRLLTRAEAIWAWYTSKTPTHGLLREATVVAVSGRGW
jgi:hypothetical protein